MPQGRFSVTYIRAKQEHNVLAGQQSPAHKTKLLSSMFYAKAAPDYMCAIPALCMKLSHTPV